MSASERDTGQQDTGQHEVGQDEAGKHDSGQQPQKLPPHMLRLPFARVLQQSSILLTYRPPPRGAPSPERPQGPPPLPGRQPSPGRESPPPIAGPAQQQKPESGIADVVREAGGLLEIGLLVLGIVLVLCARITLTRTWVWSWRTGSGSTLTLSRMHGACTSAMGELAQGASGNVASHCLWVDTTWTAVVGLGAVGCVLTVFVIARRLRAIMKPT